MVLRLVMCLMVPLMVGEEIAVAAPTPLAATNTWTGSIADESLAGAMPDHGVILDRTTFDKLATSWMFTDDTSVVDFSREIVLVATTRGSSLRLSATLAADGDVTTVAAASRDLAPGFRYALISVPKQGIKTVDHRKLPQSAAGAASDETERLSRVVANLDTLHRITDTPHRMADSTAALCRLAFNPNPHEESADRPAYCDVYVTANAEEAMASGKGAYPPGSVIVKTKLDGENRLTAVLYTVMRKMERGYDEPHGDWEYAVLDGPSRRVLARGRIDSCIECHAAYAATDHVTRAYMTPR